MCQCPSSGVPPSQMCPSSSSVSTLSSWKQLRCWVQQGKWGKEKWMVRDAGKVSEGRSQIKGGCWQLCTCVAQVEAHTLIQQNSFCIVPRKRTRSVVVVPVSRHIMHIDLLLSPDLLLSFSLKEPDGVRALYSRRPRCTCLLFRALKRLIHEGFDSTEKGPLHPSLRPRFRIPLWSTLTPAYFFLRSPRFFLLAFLFTPFNSDSVSFSVQFCISVA